MRWFSRKPKTKINPDVLRRAVKMAGRRIRKLEMELKATEAALKAVKEQCDKRMEFAEETVQSVLAIFSQSAQTPGVSVDRQALNMDKFTAELEGAEPEDDDDDDADGGVERAGFLQRFEELHGGGLSAKEMHARRKRYDEQQRGGQESGE